MKLLFGLLLLIGATVSPVTALTQPQANQTTGRYTQPTVPTSKIKLHRAKIKWDSAKHVDHFSLKLLSGAQGKHLVKKYTIDGSKHKKVVKELSADTTYAVRLKAYYTDGQHSRYSKKVSFTTDAETVPVQFGLNFITLDGADGDNTDYYTDLTNLGAQTLRQITTVDLLWSNVEPTDDNWNFADADAAIPSMPFEPIVTLFRPQYASGTPPWATASSTFQKTVGTEAEDYITTVVDRYKDDVKYWEIGNEMDHWIALSSDSSADDIPAYAEGETFTSEEQGVFLAEVSALIRAHDPDAVVIMPGMGGLNSNTLDDWLTGVVAGGGTDWFDVVNYHYYEDWRHYANSRADLQTTMEALGISDKTVWNTETGTTSDPTLTIRTNYPNSDSTQASDVFRRVVQSYAADDALVIWHTYTGNDDADNDFRYYGIVDSNTAPKLAYYGIQLLTSELLPLASITTTGTYSYTITKTDGSLRYVAWSGTTADWTVPTGVTEYTSVVPNSSGEYSWQSVEAGDTLTLTSTPILAR